MGLGPQTIDAGIFRDIYLEAYSHPRIEDVKITQRHGDNAVDVCTTVAVSGDAVDKCQVRVSIRKDMTSVRGNGHAVQETGDLEIYADGAVLLNSNSVTLTGRIHNPKLWWPNGYGDQPLYKVKVELLDEDGEVLETITKRIGLRTLTISQEKRSLGKRVRVLCQWREDFCHGRKLYSGGLYLFQDHAGASGVPSGIL